MLWDVATKRAVGVWRAHEGAILGLGDWGERVIRLVFSCSSSAEGVGCCGGWMEEDGVRR